MPSTPNETLKLEISTYLSNRTSILYASMFVSEQFEIFCIFIIYIDIIGLNPTYLGFGYNNETGKMLLCFSF